MGENINAGALGAVDIALGQPLNGSLKACQPIDFPARIVVMDERRLCREGLRLLIQSIDPELDVLEAKDTASVAAIGGNGIGPLVVLYTLIDRAENGIDGLRRLNEAHPDVRSVVLCDSIDRSLAESVIEAGAKAFLPSTTPSPVLVAVLRLVVAGGLYVPPPVLMQSTNGHDPQARGTAPREMREIAIREAFCQLTARQRSVLALLSEGCTNRTVAETLDMRENTVKAHVKQIMHKLQVDNRTQAALLADRLVARAAF